MQLKLSKLHFIITLCLLSIGNLLAGNLLESPTNSYYTYIFKLTNQEVIELYKKQDITIDETYFHTLVDSFPIFTDYKKQLKPGHYVKAYATHGQLQTSLTTVQDVNVFILNNNTDLGVQVLKLDGTIADDAIVKVNHKNLRFNKERQVYLDRKSNKKGLLRVTHNGVTSFHNLERDRNFSTIKRNTHSLLYNTPVKYVWKPIKFFTCIPYKGIRSLVDIDYYYNPIYSLRNFFRRTGHFFENSYNKVFIDKSDCSYRYSKIIFNKAKYRPGDTVMFKAYLRTEYNNPVKGTFQLFVRNKKIGVIKPYKTGFYKYKFVLNESLNLKLNSRHHIILKNNKDRVVFRKRLRYEDYELSYIDIDVDFRKVEQFRDIPFSFAIKATDENGLNIADSRVEVSIYLESVDKTFADQVFIPETIWSDTFNIKPYGKTEITIPDSIFPEANLNYSITSTLFTADNQTKSNSRKIFFFHKKEEYLSELNNDSIRFSYQKNGVEKSKNVSIYAQDNFSNKQLIYKGHLPYITIINPIFANYTIENSNSDTTFHRVKIANKNPMVECFADRSNKKVSFSVSNPRKIPFNYNIYRKNKHVISGYDTQLNWQSKTRTKQDYYAAVQYIWGGQVRHATYRIPYDDNKLNIRIEQPNVIFPGQSSKIDITVTDIKGKPAKDVDLTAYAMTKKFKHHPSKLRTIDHKRKGKKLINNFKLNKILSYYQKYKSLNYEYWKELAGLDSIEFYRFLYPGQFIYRYEYPTKLAHPQFAPFVVSKGEIIPIHVIYVDYQPVYFNWSTNKEPYSFKIDSGIHTISIRTTNHQITLKGVEFKNFKKVILSLDLDTPPWKTEVIAKPAQLDKDEKRNLYKYIFPYNANSIDANCSYIENNDRVFDLKPHFGNLSKFNLAGPVVGEVKFRSINNYDLSFYHEPYYTYNFSPQLLKMKSLRRNNYPKTLNKHKVIKTLNDEITTVDKIKSHCIKVKDKIEYPVLIDYSKEPSGILVLEPDSTIDDLRFKVFLTKYFDSSFIHKTNFDTRYKQQLSKGTYKAHILFSDTTYAVLDYIQVKPNGRNYFKFSTAHKLPKDSIYEAIDTYLYAKKMAEQVHFSKQQRSTSLSYTGKGYWISGRVYSLSDKQPIMGVNIIAVDEDERFINGSISNFNGDFKLKVPIGIETVKFSFIGCKSQTLTIINHTGIEIFLEEDNQQLQEVAIVAESVSSVNHLSAIPRRNMTGASSKVNHYILNTTEDLQGRIAGVDIVKNGQHTEITVDGKTAAKYSSTPLYIVNGNVFIGEISDIKPEHIKSIKNYTAEEATKLYGDNGKYGVVVIETIPGTFDVSQYTADKGAEFDDDFLANAAKAKSIRNNFSDYAFWQPDLTTDKNGKASFNVTFPDDITCWKTYFIAMDGKKKSGHTEAEIKSYKPLMTRVSTPRFLLQGDTTNIIGHISNFNNAPIALESQYKIADTVVSNNSFTCIHSQVDTLPVIADSDSICIEYSLKMANGYSDGELRKIPVLPIGLETTKGVFHALEGDTTVELSFDDAKGPATIYAISNTLKILENEITYLTNYRYNCNEQMASKLKAFLAKKQLCCYKNMPFDDDKKINKLIEKLCKNQNDEGLWSWWGKSNTSMWITIHVLDALKKAKAAGHLVTFKQRQMMQTLIWNFKDSENFHVKLQLLKAMQLADPNIDYNTHIKSLNIPDNLSLKEILELNIIKQRAGDAYSTATLKPFKRLTMFGNTYFADTISGYVPHTNNIYNTVLAYNFLKADTIDHTKTLTSIRNFLLTKHNGICWYNTYIASHIIEAVLPDIMVNSTGKVNASLSIKGDIIKTVHKFPFEIKLRPDQRLTVTKTGDMPVYLTGYQTFWDKKPELKMSDFEITTSFSYGPTLQAGKETELIVKVKVKKDADYVMINVPIPAGCSYTKKELKWNIYHREHFKHETAIFCRKLTTGNYTFKIKLMPRFTGRYTLNPAKVEMMYFPVFNANEAIKHISIKNNH